MTVTNTLAVGLVAVAATTGLQARSAEASISEPTCEASSTSLPSCKPHSGWYCFHPGMVEPIFNFCDPNDTNC